MTWASKRGRGATIDGMNLGTRPRSRCLRHCGILQRPGGAPNGAIYAESMGMPALTPVETLVPRQRNGWHWQIGHMPACEYGRKALDAGQANASGGPRRCKLIACGSIWPVYADVSGVGS